MGRIFEFDPQIYPTRLWVCVKPTFEEIDEKFYFLSEDGEEVVDDAKKEFQRSPSAIATCYPVCDMESLWKGILVVIWRRREVRSGVIAHESSHATDWLDDRLGLGGHSFNDGEPRAYYAQWVANCIEDVLKGRTK